MNAEELKAVVEQRMTDPTVLGRLACNLRGGGFVEQRHHDGRAFKVTWEDDGDYWRCTVSDDGNSVTLAQIDLHDNQTVRSDVFEPCRVTVSPEEGLLCVTRYRAAGSE